jgi:hypothetical protein
MGFTEIMRALPLTVPGAVENGDTGANAQHGDYAKAFERVFWGQTNEPVRSVVHKHARAHKSLAHFILSRADSMCGSYPYERRDDLAEVVRQKALAFFADAIHVSVIGRRKCYEANVFLSNPHTVHQATPDQWKALGDALSHLLGHEIAAAPNISEAPPGIPSIALGVRGMWLENVS